MFMRESATRLDPLAKKLDISSDWEIMKSLMSNKLGMDTYVWNVLIPRVCMYEYISKRDEIYKGDKVTYDQACRIAAELVNGYSGFLSNAQMGDKMTRDVLKIVFLSAPYRMAGYAHWTKAFGWTGKMPKLSTKYHMDARGKMKKRLTLEMGPPSPAGGLGLGGFNKQERDIISKQYWKHRGKIWMTILLTVSLAQYFRDRRTVFDNFKEFGIPGLFHVVDRNSPDGRAIGYRLNMFRTEQMLAMNPMGGGDILAGLIFENLFGWDAFRKEPMGYNLPTLRNAEGLYRKLTSHLSHTLNSINPASRTLSNRYSRTKSRLEILLTFHCLLFSKSLVPVDMQKGREFMKFMDYESDLLRKKHDEAYDKYKINPSSANRQAWIDAQREYYTSKEGAKNFLIRKGPNKLEALKQQMIKKHGKRSPKEVMRYLKGA